MASVRLQPDDDPIVLADALIAEGNAVRAATLLRDALAHGRGGLLLRLALVNALSAAGDNAAALSVARETSVMNPNTAPAAVSLGEALLNGGHLPSAIGEFQRALRLDPRHAEARFQLGCAWLAAGEAEKALEAFALVDADSALPNLASRIEEAQAMQARPRSDPRYVRHLFDQFSTDYDARMVGQLGYRAPSILRELAGFVGLDTPQKYAILDLGCGTGLAGAAFKDISKRIDGIDLSPAMIAKARTRGIYDELMVGDLEAALATNDRSYDLILAADTVVYLGDLTPVIAGVAKRLTPGGFFLFTVEKNDGEGFALGVKRRWRHSEDYLRREAEQASLDIAGFLACEPRSEAGVPVAGFALALQRPVKGNRHAAER